MTAYPGRAGQESSTSTVRWRNQWSARVMAAPGLHDDRLVLCVHRVRSGTDGGRGLEGHPEVDVGAICDSALDATGAVRCDRLAGETAESFDPWQHHGVDAVAPEDDRSESHRSGIERVETI